MNNIILYHGSTQPIETPMVNIGRDDLDFGKGFYLTVYQEQAERWAVRMRLIRAELDAWVSEYELNWNKIENDNYRILKLEFYDKQWLDFIVASRNGDMLWRHYDIIEGGVANDKVIDTVEDYMGGIITVEQALGQLRYTKPNHQICILNQFIIDDCLSFRKSYKID